MHEDEGIGSLISDGSDTTFDNLTSHKLKHSSFYLAPPTAYLASQEEATSPLLSSNNEGGSLGGDDGVRGGRVAQHRLPFVGTTQ